MVPEVFSLSTDRQLIKKLVHAVVDQVTIASGANEMGYPAVAKVAVNKALEALLQLQEHLETAA